MITSYKAEWKDRLGRFHREYTLTAKAMVDLMTTVQANGVVGFDLTRIRSDLTEEITFADVQLDATLEYMRSRLIAAGAEMEAGDALH